MRIFRKLVLTAVMGIALLASPTLAEPTKVEAALMALQFPGNWQQIEIPEDEVDTRWLFVTKNEAADQAIFFVNREAKDGRTLDDLSSQTRRYISKLMDGVLEYERSTTLDGAPAHIFVYEGRSEHSEQGRRKFMRAITQKGNDFYVLHGVADHVPFATHAGSMEKIVNSVEWK